MEDDHPRAEGLGERSSDPEGFFRRLAEVGRVKDRLKQSHNVPPSGDDPGGGGDSSHNLF
jgi:hypothetical protein